MCLWCCRLQTPVLDLRVKENPSHFDGVHRGSEDRVVVLDAPPVSGPGRGGQVTPVLLQDSQGFDQSTETVQGLENTQVLLTGVTESITSFLKLQSQKPAEKHPNNILDLLVQLACKQDKLE